MTAYVKYWNGKEDVLFNNLVNLYNAQLSRPLRGSQQSNYNRTNKTSNNDKRWQVQ